MAGKNKPHSRKRKSAKHSIKKISKAKLDKRWAFQVKDRVNFACEVCGKFSKFANAHHILPKRGFPELRFDLKNGICLCPRCHRLGANAAHQNSLFFALWLERHKPEVFVYLKGFLHLEAKNAASSPLTTSGSILEGGTS